MAIVVHRSQVKTTNERWVWTTDTLWFPAVSVSILYEKNHFLLSLSLALSLTFARVLAALCIGVLKCAVVSRAAAAPEQGEAAAKQQTIHSNAPLFLRLVRSAAIASRILILRRCGWPLLAASERERARSSLLGSPTSRWLRRDDTADSELSTDQWSHGTYLNWNLGDHN